MSFIWFFNCNFIERIHLLIFQSALKVFSRVVRVELYLINRTLRQISLRHFYLKTLHHESWMRWGKSFLDVQSIIVVRASSHQLSPNYSDENSIFSDFPYRLTLDVFLREIPESHVTSLDENDFLNQNFSYSVKVNWHESI